MGEESGAGVKPAKPFFRSLFEWIYDAPEYDALSAGEAWFLHLVAGQCDETLPDKSMRGCRVGNRLLETAKVDRATAYRYLKRFRDHGFVVKLGQGGGRSLGGGGLANEYGIPVRHGALDSIRVKDDPKFKTRKRSQTATVKRPSDSPDTVAACNGKPSHSATITVAVCNNNRRTVRPSHTSSSFNTHTSDHKAAKAAFVPNDDDQTLQPEPALANDASEEQIAKALSEHGIDVRRAKKLASKATPAQVNEAIARCMGQQVANPGGYLAEVVLGLVDEAEANRAREAAERSAQVGEALQQIESRIDTLPDDELVAVFDRYCERTGWPRDEGYTPEFIRNRPNTRKQVTQQMLHEASDLESAEFPNALAPDNAGSQESAVIEQVAVGPP
ncbi:MAG: hypothetical protein AAF711_11400 [Planctomycetota bacterium]